MSDDDAAFADNYGINAARARSETLYRTREAASAAAGTRAPSFDPDGRVLPRTYTPNTSTLTTHVCVDGRTHDDNSMPYEQEGTDKWCAACGERFLFPRRTSGHCNTLLRDPNGYSAWCSVPYGFEHSHNDRSATEAVTVSLAYDPFWLPASPDHDDYTEDTPVTEIDNRLKMQGEDGTPYLDYHDKAHILTFAFDGTNSPWITVQFDGRSERVIDAFEWKRNYGLGATVFEILDAFRRACDEYITGSYGSDAIRSAFTAGLDGVDLPALEGHNLSHLLENNSPLTHLAQAYIAGQNIRTDLGLNE